MRGSGEFALGVPRILEWVKQSARAVTTYYGRFPVAQVGVRIRSKAGTGISNATTWGGPPPFTRISVGQQVSEAELEDDWVMTHEFVHTGFPSVPRRHHWIEEGIATYVEPVARVQAGHLKPDRAGPSVQRPLFRPEVGARAKMPVGFFGSPDALEKPSERDVCRLCRLRGEACLEVTLSLSPQLALHA